MKYDCSLLHKKDSEELLETSQIPFKDLGLVLWINVQFNFEIKIVWNKYLLNK